MKGIRQAHPKETGLLHQIPPERQCLFCKDRPPEDLPDENMRGGRTKWYSNAIMHNKTREMVRFYLCPRHQTRKAEAWRWAREGFIAADIAELKGMAAVEKWIKLHPELKGYLR